MIVYLATVRQELVLNRRSTIARWTSGSSNSQNLIFSHFFPLAVEVAAILATSLQLNVLSAQICQMKYSVKGGGQIDVNVQKMMQKTHLSQAANP